MGMFTDDFASMVFGEDVMRNVLSSGTFRKIMKIRKEGMPMDPSIADEMAGAMKDWAIAKGATHYTHWFQPMTGITAEKHDAFLERTDDGRPILEFSSKVLVRGESDASSFPSGGMRATFEARGYTVWDPTSDAFIKDNTLCIPTAYCSYTGAVLDKKTPLLRSMEAINRESCRVLKLLGEETCYVYPNVGCEQEYFLIDKDAFRARRDLILTGRTLFGSNTTKGQLLDDHYYGSIRPRVKAFMDELDQELWKLGIFAKTEHNEVAPCQHEMAAIFNRANVSAEQNQLVMEIMKRVARRHELVCLLHEKPFVGINGSGKHNNWSLSTAEGVNLMKPGKDVAADIRFLIFVTAVIKGVDEHQDLLRISTATAGNDLRLGVSEAPPAIISIYLGEEYEALIDKMISGEEYRKTAQRSLDTNVGILPDIKKDNSDRNRTSPMAFCGSRFEFRMPGSSVNVSCSNFMINTAVSDSLRQFADRLEKAEDPRKEAYAIVREELAAHRRILFGGNGYSDEWVREAERRGLLNLHSTPEAYRYYDSPANVAFFEKNGVLSHEEITARKNIGLEEYVKTVNIEATTMLQMINKEIIPAVIAFSSDLATGIVSKSSIGIDCSCEKKLAEDISEELRLLTAEKEKMSALIGGESSDVIITADYICANIVPLMKKLRACVDKLEGMVGKDYWPYPDYTDILFYL